MSQNPNDDLRTTHDLDLVELERFNHLRATQDTNMIQGLLQTYGIQSYISGLEQRPDLGFIVRVARQDLAEAQRILRETRAATTEPKLDSE